MCGRYALSIEQQDMLDIYVAELFLDDWRPRYNIAPIQNAPVLVQTDGELGVRPFRWGLVPFWAKDPSIGNRMINARSETVAEKASFRTAWKHGRRCLVLADAFYEWQKPASGKGPRTPHAVRLADQRPFGFAALWESWNGDGGELRTFTILTTEPNELLRPIHNRMPVILGDRDAWEAWVDPDVPSDELEELLAPYFPEEMQAYPVSSYVNSPGNEGKECLRSVPD